MAEKDDKTKRPVRSRLDIHWVNRMPSSHDSLPVAAHRHWDMTHNVWFDDSYHLEYSRERCRAMGEEWEGSGGRRCVFDCVIVCGVLARPGRWKSSSHIQYVIFQFPFEVFICCEWSDRYLWSEITPCTHDQNGNWKIWDFWLWRLKKWYGEG